MVKTSSFILISKIPDIYCTSKGYPRRTGSFQRPLYHTETSHNYESSDLIAYHYVCIAGKSYIKWRFLKSS